MPEQDDVAAAISAASKPTEEIINLQYDADEVRIQRQVKPRAGRRAKSREQGKGRGRGPGNQAEAQEPRRKGDKIAGRLQKYQRGDGLKPKGVQDQRVAQTLKKAYKKDMASVFHLAKSEVLQTAESGYLQAEGREKTYKIRQAQILKETTAGAARKAFSFELPYGPYSCAYTSNGQYLIAGGRKGQVAMLHCDTMKIMAELQLQETTRAVQALHNHTMFAVAQKKYAYIYDHNGVELHCMKDHKYPTHLEFLPYHYLLVSAGDFADLHYRDISTGKEVCVHKTRLGPCRSLRQNPRNAVVHVGHSNGNVTLWTPNVKEPVVKVLCHAGHVNGLAVHGDYMVTAGDDGLWKVWDLRKYDSVYTFRSYGHAVHDLDISMSGLVAVGFGSHLEIWKGAVGRGSKPRAPYMSEEYPGKLVNGVRFRPYEDVCGIGLSTGFANILVPGAGYANFDSFEANPFETKNQRREKEVRSLLEKLQPDSIMLNPNEIGNIDKAIVSKFEAELEKKMKEEAGPDKLRKRMRGANKVGNRERRKQLKKSQEQRQKTKSRLDGEEVAGVDDEPDEGAEGSQSGDDDEAGGEADAADSAAVARRRHGAALGRFYGKRRRKT